MFRIRFVGAVLLVAAAVVVAVMLPDALRYPATACPDHTVCVLVPTADHRVALRLLIAALGLVGAVLVLVPWRQLRPRRGGAAPAPVG